MLTTAEEFLLLALDESTGDFRKIQSEYFHAGLVGAVVMELALTGHIDSDVESAWVVDPSPTGVAALDLVLAEMARPGFPAKLETIIEHLMPLGEGVKGFVLAALCGSGVLRRSEGRSILLAKVTRFTVSDGRDFEATKNRLRALLAGDGLPDPRDVCLLALAKTCGLIERIVPAADLQGALDRLSKFSSLDLIGQNVRRYLYVFERDMAV